MLGPRGLLKGKMAAQVDFLSNPVPVSVDIASDSTHLEEFSIPNKIVSNLHRIGVESFFPVQSLVVPRLLEDSCGPLLRTVGGALPRDVCVSAPTGSGKTLAYVVPIVSVLSSSPSHVLRSVVVVPSQDLVEQVGKVFEDVARDTGLVVCRTSGQCSLSMEQETLVDPACTPPLSKVDILVTTPGRLVDHINRTPHFSLSCLRYLVVDEVDRLLDQTFQDWMDCVIQARNAPCNQVPAFQDTSHLLEHLMGRLKGISPAVDSKLSTVCCGSHSQADKDGRGLQGTHPGPPYQPPTASSILSSKYPFQKLLFSATLAQNPEKLALLRLYHPILFSASDHTPSVKSWYHLPPTLVEYAVECSGENKPDVLLRLLTQRKLKKVLCFTNTKESVHLLCTYLSDHTQELVVGEYSSFVSKSQRGKSIIDFNTGRTDVLVCSDAMSRGMDLDQVNVDFSHAFTMGSRMCLVITSKGRRDQYLVSGLICILHV